MARPSDWYVLDMDNDPTPGDPDRVRQLASRFHDFAENAHRAKMAVDSLQGDGALLTWVGKSGDAFRSQFGDFPSQVDKLYRSHLMVGDALEAYAPTLENAQTQADRALADGRLAAEKLKSLQGSLGIAETDFSGAAQAADRARAETQAPDPDQVKQAVRDAEAAEQKRNQAKAAVAGAQGELDLAKQLAMQAKELRDGASRTCAREIDAASDAGIQPRSFWAKLGDALKQIWDIICEVAKWVALVAGVIAMIIGGPLAWVALAAGAILLIKAIVDFSQGKGSVMDLVFGLLGVIPGVRGLTSISKLSALYKAGGLKEIGKAALQGMKTLANDMVDIVKGIGAGAVSVVKNIGGLVSLGAAKLTDLFQVKVPPVPKDVARTINIRECVSDPIDVATGEMVLPLIDLELPAPLPFTLERTHLSSYRAGSLFGASWASTLDQRLETDAEATLFFAADAMVLVYPIGAAGTAVLPEEGPRWPLTVAADGSAILEADDRLLGFDDQGRLCTVADTDGNTLRVERDEDGTPSALQHPSGRRVLFTVADGRIAEITLANTKIAAFGYDDSGRLTEAANISGKPARFRYDGDGRVMQWIDRNDFGYRYTYDEDGRCTGTMGEDGFLSATLVYEDGRTTWTDSLGNVTVYTFDEYHHVTSVTDPLGNTGRSTWGRYNEQFTRPAAPVDRLDLDRLRGGRPANPDRAEGLAGWSVRLDDGETVVYDAEGYPVERTDAAGNVRRTAYGPFGVVLATVDADGLRTSYTYDTELRVTSVTDPAGLLWRYEYDAAGRVTAETDFNGRARRFTHDAAGNVTAVDGVPLERDETGNLIRRGSHIYAYDQQGRLVAASGPGVELSVEWDADGRKVAETVNGRTVRVETDGTSVTRHTPAGAVSVWESDPFGRPYSLRSGGHEMLLKHDFAGREAARSIDGTPVLAQLHGTGDRLLGQILPAVGGRVFEHRADGAVSGAVDWTGRRAYTLDATGRVTRVQGPGRDENHRYSYGRPDGVYDGTSLRSSGAVQATYDSLGRMVTRTRDGVGTWHFAWNDDDRLIEATTPAGAVWRYTYDPLGRRIAKTDGVERFDFTWSGSTLVEEEHLAADGTLSVTTWEHHPSDGRPLARTVRIGGDLDFATVVTDRVGTPTELLAADGTLRWQSDATLWGYSDTTEMPVSFPGQYRDLETGLHYNVFRYYDPLTGRYLSQDPLGLAPAIDPAGYASNPLRFADPLGLMCTSPGGSSVPKPTPGSGDIPGLVQDMDELGDIGLALSKTTPEFKNPADFIKDLTANKSNPPLLFHGSDVPPDIIFKQGLQSNAMFKNAGSHYDIKLHQQNSSKIREGGVYSGFVSTTEDWNVALNFVRDKDIAFQLQNKSMDGVEFSKNIGGKDYKLHYGYVYAVRADSQPFVELNVQTINDISKVSQKEFAALDHIPGKNISHAYLIDTPYNVGIKDGIQQLDIPKGPFKMETFDNPDYVAKKK
ncbi:DUF6531 domain-containing protein [Actinoplanes derwentensis]|uniref:RHS repeat-associated core domain-containing protein n=1 Tax=Actinoplanes derwentensis TaxID=113562 RepID=A0A1H1U287_9ACTN|nr:DUF6531 domain-containing protein [Actinoplanes derwentensis]GID85175.1 hypothetical protein Ade03nite_40990 [Actinoplanes derwentensis]SDS66582.1 RHS repeat-associated core domain-containing protein [Actinoplanes derwentensis]